MVTRKDVPHKEGKKRIPMGTELLLSGFFILLVLGLFVAAVYYLFLTLQDASMQEALAPDPAGQHRFLPASLPHSLTQLEE